MVTITCKHCQKQFQVKPYRASTAKYCSNKCRKLDKQALTEQLMCPVCEKSFARLIWKRSSHTGCYCSQECYSKRSPQTEVECICGKKFKANQSRISYYGRVYCSQQCYLKNGYFGRLTNDIPEASAYSKFVEKLRSTARYLKWSKACLDRDKYKCIQCNSQEGLTVHHKEPIFSFIKKYGLNQKDIESDPLFFDINNGETLCRSCHLNQHRRKDE